MSDRNLGLTVYFSRLCQWKVGARLNPLGGSFQGDDRCETGSVGVGAEWLYCARLAVIFEIFSFLSLFSIVFCLSELGW